MPVTRRRRAITQSTPPLELYIRRRARLRPRPPLSNPPLRAALLKGRLRHEVVDEGEVSWRRHLPPSSGPASQRFGAPWRIAEDSGG